MMTTLVNILVFLALIFGILFSLLLIFRIILDLYDYITEIFNKGDK